MIESFDGRMPDIDSTAFVHERSFVGGDVRIGAESSIWPGAVLRGDVGPIVIGARSNLQDNAVVHVTGGLSETVLGDRVTVGHTAILHGCRIADDCLVGMGAIVMDNVEVGPFSLIAAGALLPPGKRYPPGVLILGRPGRVVRALTDEERASIGESAAIYVGLARTWAGG